MRLVHTSDWHLGQSLYDLPREREQAAFLGRLRDVLRENEIDALLVAGDVFDSSNPPAAAQRLWYEFLASVWRDLPAIQVVVIGGNHDSAARLEAARPMLDALGRLHVIGTLRRTPEGSVDGEAMLVPLKSRGGEVTAWVAAVPFLRPADLSPGLDLVEGVGEAYAAALDAARAKRGPAQALIATGHLYMVGGRVSELSERKIQCGNQLAVPAEIFPEDVTYAALGHLHLAQRVGGLDRVRYSGAPIPLAMPEADYPHQVSLVEIEGSQLRAVRPIRIPVVVPMLRIPASGAGSIEEVLAALVALPDRRDGEDPMLFPYLEVAVQVREPEPGLRQRLQKALEEKRARLVRFSQVASTAAGAEGVSLAGERRLDEIQPREVFQACWRLSSGSDPSPEVASAFEQLREWAEDPEAANRRREERASA